MSPHPRTRLARKFHEPLYSHNIVVDFVRPDADLSAYRLVLVPNLYLVRKGVSTNFERFVESGGTLAISFFSEIVDEEDHIFLGGYPAPSAGCSGSGWRRSLRLELGVRLRRERVDDRTERAVQRALRPELPWGRSGWKSVSEGSALHAHCLDAHERKRGGRDVLQASGRV